MKTRLSVIVIEGLDSILFWIIQLYNKTDLFRKKESVKKSSLKILLIILFFFSIIEKNEQSKELVINYTILIVLVILFFLGNIIHIYSKNIPLENRKLRAASALNIISNKVDNKKIVEIEENSSNINQDETSISFKENSEINVLNNNINQKTNEDKEDKHQLFENLNNPSFNTNSLAKIEIVEQKEEIKKTIKFDDKLKHKITGTIEKLNLLENKTDLALLLIYIHKINPEYKTKYAQVENTIFLKNIRIFLESFLFTDQYYSSVMKSISVYFSNDGRIKEIKEINKLSSHYHRFDNIQKTFDNLSI